METKQFQWEFVGTATKFSCCASCTAVVEGNKPTANNRREYIFDVSLEKHCKYNAGIVHTVVVNVLNKDKNPFKDFSSLFDSLVLKQNNNEKLFVMNILERIYLRALRLRCVPIVKDAPIVHNIRDTKAIQLSANLGPISVREGQDSAHHDVISSTRVVVETSCEEFQQFTTLVHQVFHCQLESFVRRILLGFLLGRMEHMFQVTRENPVFSFGRRNTAYCYLQFIKNKLRTAFAEFQDDRVQIHELVGESGIGKSKGVLNLSYVLQAMLPELSYDNLVWSRVNDRWWSGYTGQPIVLYDDYTHYKNCKFELAAELISVASGTFRNPPMAFLKDTLFTSTICILTSNVPLQTTIDSSKVAPLKRRVISQHWQAFCDCVSGGIASFNGTLLNSIESADRKVFSLFSESWDITNESSVFEFSFKDTSIVIGNDTISGDPNGSTSSRLTSSVPVSCTAILEEVGASCEAIDFGRTYPITHERLRMKDFNLIISQFLSDRCLSLAQVNQMLSGKAIISAPSYYDDNMYVELINNKVVKRALHTSMNHRRDCTVRLV